MGKKGREKIRVLLVLIFWGKKGEKIGYYSSNIVGEKRGKKGKKAGLTAGLLAGRWQAVGRWKARRDGRTGRRHRLSNIIIDYSSNISINLGGKKVGKIT